MGGLEGGGDGGVELEGPPEGRGHQRAWGAGGGEGGKGGKGGDLSDAMADKTIGETQGKRWSQ